MKNVRKQLYEHRKELYSELNKIVLSECIVDDIHNKIRDLLRTLNNLDGDTSMLLFDNLSDMEKNLKHISSYLNQRYRITSDEMETLHQIIIGDTEDDTKKEIDPEYVKEFDEMLSDGDVPF